MKQKILAVCLFAIILVFVITNTIILQNAIDILTQEIYQLDTNSSNAMEQFRSIDETFKNHVGYFGLTVSHDDITNIEDCFAELSGYLSVKDTNEAEVTRYRLIHYLEHLRRLVGFNIDSII